MLRKVRHIYYAMCAEVDAMDAKLREIVDYDAVDAKVKAYDRAAFSEWRDEQKAAGTYESNMARIFAGWDQIPEDHDLVWSAEDEARIEEWLAKGP